MILLPATPDLVPLGLILPLGPALELVIRLLGSALELVIRLLSEVP